MLRVSILVGLFIFTSCSQDSITQNNRNEDAPGDGGQDIASADAGADSNQDETPSDNAKVYIPDEYKDRSDVGVYEGSVIASDTTAAYLNLPADTIIEPASMPAEVNVKIQDEGSDEFRPARLVEIANFTLELDQIVDEKKSDDELVVIYLVKDDSGSDIVGLISKEEINLEENKAVFSLAGNGTYQLAYVSPIQKESIVLNLTKDQADAILNPPYSFSPDFS